MCNYEIPQTGGLYQLDDTNRKPIADYPVYVNVQTNGVFSLLLRDAQAAGDRVKAILQP